MTREGAVAFLLAMRVAPDVASLYATSLTEYGKAQANIDANGTVCAHPRSGVPIDNPFVRVRDKCEAKLVALGERIPREAVAELWAALREGREPEVIEAPPAAGGDAVADQLGAAWGF